MPKMINLPVDLTLDAMLRSQEMDPELVRERSPELVEDSLEVLEEGKQFFQPRVSYESYGVEKVFHSRLLLEGGKELRGRFLVNHLAPAEQVVVLLCTIGERLEDKVSDLFAEDPVRAFMLDALGSAAVERLSSNAVLQFEKLAESKNWGVSVPLSPGMESWTLEEGQPQIFDLVLGEEIGVSLTESFTMRPAKSLSLVLGMGPRVETLGTICDYCAVRSTCRHRSEGKH